MNQVLNMIAPVGKTGYGVTGFNVLKGLRERDWRICLFGRGQHFRTANEAQLVQFAMNEGLYFDYDAPCLNIWHQNDLGNSVGKGKYVGWPIFELDTFDEVETHNLNYPDELIVCSKWAKKVCEDNGIEPKIHVVPLGIDNMIFNTRVRSQKETENTVFLNVGKWEIRKGHDILGDTFNTAFSKDDNVELWLMPHNQFISKEDERNWERMYLDTEMGRHGKIKILSWVNTHQEVCQIMAQTDCGVFPSRAEGWNLEPLEMMALGKPIIITNYSGHTEFCDKDNSYLIDIDKLEPAYDGQWFFEQGNWAELGEPQIKVLVEHMRSVHDKVQRPGSFVNDAGIETAQKFSWDYSLDLLENILTSP